MTQKPATSFICFDSPEGTKRVSYYDWGDSSNLNIIVCIGGNSVTADLFDDFCQFACTKFRVVAISLPGRGESEYFDDYKLYKGHEMYVKCVYQIFQHLFAQHNSKELLKISYYGRCLGSQIGYKLNMFLPSLGLKFHKYISYDFGTTSPKDMLYKLVSSYGGTVEFNNLEEAECQMKSSWARNLPNGAPDSFWKQIVSYSYKLDVTSKKFVPNWDNVKICKALKETLDEIPDDINLGRDLNYEWGFIDCPILLIKHEFSRVLSNENLMYLYVQENTLKRKLPNHSLSTIVVPSIGHVPAPLDTWLLEDMIKFYLN